MDSLTNRLNCKYTRTAHERGNRNKILLHSPFYLKIDFKVRKTTTNVYLVAHAELSYVN